MKSILDRKLDGIRRGIYTFDEVGSVDLKNQICDILIDDYNKGVITDEALKSMIDHYYNQIVIFSRIKLEDVPEQIRQLVSDKINK